ncbi:putative tubulin--tyrosine ligase pby1 [Malassezia equina]|uniref:Tubulin--tyrosine ligase pby1 n=1 Tax=Malassezia equina TaxID=1381935 RepID=A0AAF0IYX3_9BASI|nr:putative tubulin--tyrosine ligase pby1 [Malassezia equina]
MPRAWVCFLGAPYTHRAALKAAEHVLGSEWRIEDAQSQPPVDSDSTPKDMDAYIADYDLLPFEALMGSSSIGSSYMIRKALIRKHYLANAIHSFHVKHPDFVPKVPKTWMLDIQFADELDEMLADDLFDLREELERNETAEKKSWFILKPGMADQANGIRLFSSVQELVQIFEELEDADNESEKDEDTEQGIASQLRFFVIQEYIAKPLLVSPSDPSNLPRKFHLRAYVICVGGLQVYLHDDMLALFSSIAYTDPTSETVDLRGHLSNTCYGKRHSSNTETEEGNVFTWRDLLGKRACLPGQDSIQLSEAHIQKIHHSAVQTIGEVFGAVAREGSVHWQMWPNSFEIFGVDLLVGCDNEGDIHDPSSLRTWLLEINAQPDFQQSGPELTGIVEHVFKRAIELGVLRESAWTIGDSVRRCTCCFAEDLIRT